MNRQQFLKDLAKVKRGYRLIKENPSRYPHCIELPDGRIIDLLDGETEKLLAELDWIAAFGDLK